MFKEFEIPLRHRATRKRMTHIRSAVSTEPGTQIIVFEQFNAAPRKAVYVVALNKVSRLTIDHAIRNASHIRRNNRNAHRLRRLMKKR